jgi:hypothetical protein
MKEEQTDVSRMGTFVGAVDDIHLPRQLDEWHLGGFAVQVAVNFLQIRANKRQPKVGKIRPMALAVIKRDRGRQPQEFSFVFTIGLKLCRA